METKREILSFEVPYEDYVSWSLTNRIMIMSETIVAAEELLYNNLEKTTVINLVLIKSPKEKLLREATLNRKDIKETMELLIEWAIGLEEYELCARIRNINEFLENDNRPKTTRRVRQIKKSSSGTKQSSGRGTNKESI
jgi:hypothetical protein